MSYNATLFLGVPLSIFGRRPGARSSVTEKVEFAKQKGLKKNGLQYCDPCGEPFLIGFYISKTDTFAYKKIQNKLLSDVNKKAKQLERILKKLGIKKKNIKFRLYTLAFDSPSLDGETWRENY